MRGRVAREWWGWGWRIAFPLFVGGWLAVVEAGAGRRAVGHEAGEGAGGVVFGVGLLVVWGFGWAAGGWFGGAELGIGLEFGGFGSEGWERAGEGCGGQIVGSGGGAAAAGVFVGHGGWEEGRCFECGKVGNGERCKRERLK